MFSKVILLALGTAMVAGASPASADYLCGYYHNMMCPGQPLGNYRPDPNDIAMAQQAARSGFSSGGYAPYGYGGGTNISAAPGSKVDYSESPFGGTKLGIDKNCEKLGGGRFVCKKADGTLILITKNGASPM